MLIMTKIYTTRFASESEYGQCKQANSFPGEGHVVSILVDEDKGYHGLERILELSKQCYCLFLRHGRSNTVLILCPSPDGISGDIVPPQADRSSKRS